MRWFFCPNSFSLDNQCANNMAVVINSLYMSEVKQVCVCVSFKILMWTLLACERRVNILLLTCVYLLHIAKYLYKKVDLLL